MLLWRVTRSRREKRSGSLWRGAAVTACARAAPVFLALALVNQPSATL